MQIGKANIALAAMALGWTGAMMSAQGQLHDFHEREPRTDLEKTIGKLMPSVVKIHGASGLKTVLAYASGVVVSEKGHILTLDQALIQPEITKIVLYDGTVCRAEPFSASDKYGVR